MHSSIAFIGIKMFCLGAYNTVFVVDNKIFLQNEKKTFTFRYFLFQNPIIFEGTYSQNLLEKIVFMIFNKK